MGMRYDPIGINPKLPRGNEFAVAAEKELGGFIKNLQRVAQTYPPQRNPGHSRTGTLRRSWSSGTMRSTGRIVGEVGSNSGMAPYNRKVQGENAERAFWAEGYGWPGVDALAHDVVQFLPLVIQQAIDRVLDQAGA